MADILTRREARQQAKQNRGYNRGQFQLAMANAKNALRDNSDLRGRELRQTARRMVAGVGEYAPSQETTTSASSVGSWGNNYNLQPFSRGVSRFADGNVTGLDLSVFNRPFSFSTSQPIATRTETPAEAPAQTTVQAAETPAPQYKDGDDFTSMGKFGSAFAAASKAGLKTFMWNGKSYGTRKASTPEEIAAWKKAKGISTSTSSNTSSTTSPSTGSSISSNSNSNQSMAENRFYTKPAEAPSHQGYDIPDGYNMFTPGLEKIVGKPKYKSLGNGGADNLMVSAMGPDMDHYYGGVPMPIGKTVGYRPANSAIAGSNPNYISGAGALVTR